MRIEGIFACDHNGVIGIDGDLPWHSPEDLAEFKTWTDGMILIMGRKTFESLPGLLPNRHHVVITSQDRESSEHVTFVKSPMQAFKALPKIAKRIEAREPYGTFAMSGVGAMVIGGVSLLENALVMGAVDTWHVSWFNELWLTPGENSTVTEIDFREWRKRFGLTVERSSRELEPRFRRKGDTESVAMPYWSLTLRRKPVL